MSALPDVFVVRTGVANLGSMMAGLSRAGSNPKLTDSPGDIQQAPLVVVPGVGTFGETMQKLKSSGMDNVLHQRFLSGQPLLFVCVGLQILGAQSEESPNCAGLSFLPAKVVHFPTGVHVPQQGWNRVTASANSKYIQSGDAYFSNSFCFVDEPVSDGWTASTAEHGVTFTAAVERGAFLACQFHPELSGSWGQSILRRWIEHAPSNVISLTSVPVMQSIRTVSFKSGLTRRIIPCLDVKDGKVVKGVKFQDLKEAGSPSERASFYQEQGADEIVMLDISATIEGRRTALQTIREIRRELMIPLTVGGGVTSTDAANAILEAGADKVSLNTAAVRDPTLLSAMAAKFGRQCTVLAVDAIQFGPGKWEVVVSSGKEKTGLDVVEWVQQAVRLGAGEILLTSWDRDGTKSGYDCDLLRRVSSAVDVPVIASGGAASAAHLSDADRKSVV